MRNFFMRAQLAFVSVILLLTFVLTMALVMRYNHRWDVTRDKLFSLDPATVELLEALHGKALELYAFYPQDDPSRAGLEVFLEQVKMHDPDFSYRFYDPERAPRIAADFGVRELYTIILRMDGRSERMTLPGEEGFTSALLRLANPRAVNVCFVTGHGEAPIRGDKSDSYSLFRQFLEFRNYTANEIILSRDDVPPTCHVVVVAGPHRNMDNSELAVLRAALEAGKSMLFLIDPMEPGQGESFRQFFANLGVTLGRDVIVDKMGRMVGGDFLTPVISQYVAKHPVSGNMKEPSFIPMSRSVQPSTEGPDYLEVTPLAFTGSGSWAENNLDDLEIGKANFDAEFDLSGPLSVAVAVEADNGLQPEWGRLIVVGDSGFLSNGFFDIGGNRAFGLSMVQWLARDERVISIPPKQPRFQPLFMTMPQRTWVLAMTLAGLPLIILLIGGSFLIYRMRTS